ncbi:MAG: M3 family metallopeptidase [Cardiobacteriaceae bacterium]|nr:M3 family metallopeptidase [Cardiobacteriaceae bacterium]
MSLENNLFYRFDANPDYRKLKAEDAYPAISQILKDNQAAIAKIVAENKNNRSWDNLMLKLAELDNNLSLAFFPLGHLHSVLSEKDWRDAYEKILPELSEYSSQMSQNQELYQAILDLKNSAEFIKLSDTKKKIINDEIADFERRGVNLAEDKKEKYREINRELSELTTNFSNNVLDATNAWELYLEEDDSRLQGLPNSAISMLKNLAIQKEKPHSYRLTLDAPVYIAVMSYAEDRKLREIIYRAYNARASELSDNGKFNNFKNITRIRELRQELAQLLGFEDYAALSTADNKMAKNPRKVAEFLEDLREKSYAAGKREIEELEQFAREELQIEKLEAWDISFASEKMRQKRYQLSQEDLRPYFPLSKVISGMFAIVENLFAVSFVQEEAEHLWHRDVRAFAMLDANGKTRARFALDPYAREKKRGGAWMDSAVERFFDGENKQIPTAYLVCNFTPPENGEAYITLDEVTTLFHEFGHGLHHMLTTVDEYQAAGINGVEWDAVEQPSQFMENFCYEPECLKMISAHRETGEPLPQDLLDKVIAAKNHHSAMAMLRQLEFAIFDLRVHSKEFQNADVLEILRQVRREVAVVPEFADNRFPMQFSHIFAGGYAAGYYSYKWAEVLSADSFSAFEEEGVLNPQTGARFYREILARGSSRSSQESFIAFRGREPNTDALLRHNGIK